MKIGVMVGSFRAGLDGGLEAAREVGAAGVQIYATTRDFCPEALDGAARRALRRRLADLGLELAALCGDFGGHGFSVAADNPQRIADCQRIMDLAVDLGGAVVTTHIGVVPADRAVPRDAVMARACEALGRYGEKVGATFAIETGPEPAGVLRRFLDDVALPRGLGVNFDPANLAMVINEDIPAAVRTLGPYIVHTHAKDGYQRQAIDPEILYGVVPHNLPDFKWSDYLAEVPLGEGRVPWPAYLAALRQAGFDGYLTVEREVGDQPRRDIEAAVNFLREALVALPPINIHH